MQKAINRSALVQLRSVAIAEQIKRETEDLNAFVDLGDLEEMGLIPEAEEQPARDSEVTTSGAEEEAPFTGRESLSLPWFESMMAGSRLGTLRTSKGSNQSRDGRVKVEWEVLEWTGDNVDTSNPAKRKKRDPGEVDEAMEGAPH